jgi:hypothetical protein
MRNHKVTKLIALVGAVLFFSACTWTEPTRVEAYHGDAVNSIKAAQVYDRDAALNPSADPVEGTDGQRMEGVMEHHRGYMGSAESASQPIVINTGN